MLKNHTTTQQSVSADNHHRIAALDGLRGLAIVMVVLFHTYHRWPNQLPWVVTQPECWLFKYGFLGVQLFFLISGYVIYLTLEKCSTFREFAFRRWLRLFPAMLLGSLCIYLTSAWLRERPNGIIQPQDLMPGLLFIEDRWINLLLHGHGHLKTIEGAFWSLFVEVKFYAFFGSLYFVFKRHALAGLIGLFLMTFINESLVKYVPAYTFRAQNAVLYDLLSLKHFGWFCVGALLYKAKTTQRARYAVWSAVLLCPTILIQYGRDWSMMLACSAVYAVFYLGLNWPVASRLLGSRWPVFMGFVSYPLYLIHENAMVALTIKTHQDWPALPAWFTPWPGLLGLLTVAYALARWGEPLLRSAITPTQWLRAVYRIRRRPLGSHPSPH